MERDIWSYYGLWWTALLWTMLTALFLLFLPLHRRDERRQAGVVLAFTAAYSIEKYGFPFSRYLVARLTGCHLPVGILWGHTLSGVAGMAGHHIYLALIVLGGSLVVAGWAYIYGNGRNTPGTEPVLVRDGLYRYLRHPQYAGLILMTFGAILDWATIPLIATWPILVRGYLRLARREDQQMERIFGEVWKEYAARTGRFIPKIPVFRRHFFRRH